jgi:hypothetical protein
MTCIIIIIVVEGFMKTISFYPRSEKDCSMVSHPIPRLRELFAIRRHASSSSCSPNNLDSGRMKFVTETGLKQFLLCSIQKLKGLQV